MAITITQKVRHGTPMPILGTTSTSTGAVMFTFGFECQEVETCSSEGTVKKSEEFCLMGGEYWSANYKALPQKVDSKVKYQATLTKRPVLSAESNCATTGGDCDLLAFNGVNTVGGNPPVSESRGIDGLPGGSSS